MDAATAEAAAHPSSAAVCQEGRYAAGTSCPTGRPACAVTMVTSTPVVVPTFGPPPLPLPFVETATAGNCAVIVVSRGASAAVGVCTGATGTDGGTSAPEG